MVNMCESGEIEASGLSFVVILTSGPWNLLTSTKFSIFSGDTLNFLWVSSMIMLKGAGILDAKSDFQPVLLKEWPNVSTFRLPLLMKFSTMWVVEVVGFSVSGVSLGITDLRSF